MKPVGLIWSFWDSEGGSQASQSWTSPLRPEAVLCLCMVGSHWPSFMPLVHPRFAFSHGLYHVLLHSEEGWTFPQLSKQTKKTQKENNSLRFLHLLHNSGMWCTTWESVQYWTAGSWPSYQLLYFSPDIWTPSILTTAGHSKFTTNP